jgi:hypothetical protein
MQEIHTYHIEVKGQLDVIIFNASSPLKISLEKIDPVNSLFAIYTDQSGLIGLLRYLHQQGFVILSAYCSDYSTIRREKLRYEKGIIP